VVIVRDARTAGGRPERRHPFTVVTGSIVALVVVLALVSGELLVAVVLGVAASLLAPRLNRLLVRRRR
jgi:Flp pilus assembly protein TadB